MSFVVPAFVVLYVVASVVLALVMFVAVARWVRLARRRRTERVVAPLRPLLIRLAAADEVDQEAFGALASLPEKQWRVIEPRVFRLLDKVRGLAATAIEGLLVSRGAVTTSVIGARSPSPVKRANAIVRLAALRQREQAGLIEQMLRDADEDVRRAAAIALGKIGRAESVRPLLESVPARRSVSPLVVGDALVRIGHPAVADLIAALSWGCPWQRQLAAEALGRIGTTVAEEALAAAAAGDESENVRAAAARALRKAGTWYAAGPLLDIAKSDPCIRVRCEAILALSEHSGAPVVEPLEIMLGDLEYDIASVAALALTRMGLPGREVLERAAAGNDHWAASHAMEALMAADLDEQLGRRALRRAPA